ncbi:MAG: AMP-binding protein [Planctomycetes bacterium]|nr:AMP-binding protein [Planctomycetota bacterium]MBL7037668.1 AMP-binding protein [Pirellulaceae bacterium]
MQLESFLETSATQFPDKIALVCGKQRLTYAELDQQCNRLAHALLAEGIERGDRVAVYLDNSVEAVVSVFAILKAGAVFMMVNPTTKADKLTYVLNNSRAAAVILPARAIRTLHESLADAPHLRHVVIVGDAVPDDPVSGKACFGFNDLAERHQTDILPPPKRAIDVDLAALIYTSGSTGNPKGVMVTHLNMVSAATSITTYLRNVPEDIILNVLPLSFDYGLYQVLMSAKIGGTVVLERSFTYPHAVMQKLVQEKATGFPLVPTISAILLQMDLGKYDLSHLRYVSNTGAALPSEHIFQLRELFPHVQVYSMYGLTECKRVSYLPPEDVDQRPTSVGRGMPNEEVYIVDENDRRVAPGVVGELVVRGSNVMRGYWELPEETGRMLRPGPLPNEKVLYTGDLFRMDEDGYLYFVGRKDDIIKSRGEKVSPKEVENVLYSHPEVAEAAVVGVPDAILGQAIKAVIAPKDGCQLSDKEIMRYCAGRLEDFMVPKWVEVRPSLPKTGNGKIDKRELSGVSA